MGWKAGKQKMNIIKQKFQRQILITNNSNRLIYFKVTAFHIKAAAGP